MQDGASARTLVQRAADALERVAVAHLLSTVEATINDGRGRFLITVHNFDGSENENSVEIKEIEL